MVGTVPAATFVAVYVIFNRDKSVIARAGKVAVADYDDVDDLLMAVVATVQESGHFLNYLRGQLASGDLFVLKQPTSGKPSHPGTDGLGVGPVKVKAGDCILLDISASEFRCPFVPPTIRQSHVSLSRHRPHPAAFARPIALTPIPCR